MPHAVQLFDSADSLAVHVAAFLHRGYLLGEELHLITTSEHMAGIARQLGALGCPVNDALASRQLRWADAANTLRVLMPDGRIDHDHLRSLIREIARTTTRVYGEMVDLLAERGNLKGAVELETAWNRALAGVPTSLLCGYSSGHFGDLGASAALREICLQHDDIRCCSTDLLGSWLVQKSQS